MSQLSYRELQGKLKTFKEQGYQLNVKLNAKQEVLQAEWERITLELEAQVQEVLTPKDVTISYTTAALPAMTAPAPTWLKQEHKVFYIDNGCGYETDYLMHEVNQWLAQNEGVACEVSFLKCILDSGANEECQTYTTVETQPLESEFLRNVKPSSDVMEYKELAPTSRTKPTPSITRLLGLVIAAMYLLGLSVCSKSWQGLKALASATNEPTCTQAIQNAEWFSRCALGWLGSLLAFIQGLLF